MRQLDEMRARAPIPRPWRKVLRRELRARLAEWHTLVADPNGARRLLQTTLDGWIVFTPEADRYRVKVPLVLDRVFEGVLPIGVSSPTIRSSNSELCWTELADDLADLREIARIVGPSASGCAA